MRAITLFSLAAFLIVAEWGETVDCLVTASKDSGILHHAIHGASSNRHRQHHRHQKPQQPKDQAPHGTGYKLLSMFSAAMHYKNFTWASSLLADEGSFLITDVSCSPMSKSSFMTLAMTDGVAQSQAIFGAWTETAGGLTIVHAEVGAIFGPTAAMPNQTYYNPNVYFIVAPTMDGTQIASLQRWSDASYRQSNATAMLNTFNTIIAASTLGDITPWYKIVTPDFTFSMFYPFDQHLPFSANATAFLDVLLHQYQNQVSCTVKVQSVFPVCEFIGAEVMVFIQNQQGPAMVHKYFLSLRLDWLMRINLMQEFGLGFM